jgi:hypothetical protein
MFVHCFGPNDARLNRKPHVFVCGSSEQWPLSKSAETQQKDMHT